jgi:predicted nucleic acid-binding protein
MSKIPVVVPDASVLLKWVLASNDEQDTHLALTLREAWLSGHCAIVLPSLWFFEVGNIVGMKQPGNALQLMQKLTGYGFEEEPAHAIHELAFQLMRKFKVTFYDAAYHTVALNHGGAYVTSDDRYARKAARAGHVVLLANWRNSSPTSA